MFGLLNEAEVLNSLEQRDYEKSRGKFYLIWNASKISGRPMLVALMAGNAAHEAETTDTHKLLADITARLRVVFPVKPIPPPIEVIVTRWKRDPFTRGTYSYVAPETRPGDYDLMAQSVGNLHFAGEATCGTHPATVHGALLSGLRVAAEVMDAMAGPISLPMPLVGPPTIKRESTTYRAGAVVLPPSLSVQSQHALPVTSATLTDDSTIFIKKEHDTIQTANILPLASVPIPHKLAGPPKQSVCAADPSFWVQSFYSGDDLSYEASIVAATLSQIGERPIKPSRPGVNPFLLYTKDKWEQCKAHCSGNGTGVAGRDAIRSTLGAWWRAATDEAKQPYITESQKSQETADAIRKEWDIQVAQWDSEAARIRREYVREFPPPVADGAGLVGLGGGAVGISKRKTNVSNCVVLDAV